MIAVEQLVNAGLLPAQANVFVGPLNVACSRFDITKPARIAAFIAQCRVESLNFRRLEEDLYYTHADRIRAVFPTTVPTPAIAETLTRSPQRLANFVYGEKNGNRGRLTNDGYNYRGRGLIGLTGLENYTNAGIALDRPYTALPDLVAKPDDAALVAAWYWNSRKCNLLADAGQIDAITHAVNGKAMREAETRRDYTTTALEAFA